ncbi:MAG: universal stress protein, partial [Nitrosopumilaceae archaeon]
RKIMTRSSTRKRIIITIDQSDYAEKIMKAAYDVAENIDADVNVLTVIETPELAAAGELDSAQMDEEEKKTSEYQKRLIDTNFSGSALLVESIILHGDPAKKICELAKKVNASLVVIGTRGHGKIQSKLLGSVSDKVIKNCHCSVLIVRK